MTSSPKPLELDKKKSGGGSIWGDKHKAGKPKRRSVPLWLSQLMTSSPKPPELDKKKSGGGQEQRTYPPTIMD
ncbi:hypothetical protein ASG66_07105 [Bacillus sp. Leaf406]|nr:hypothetical protein ASG66_07105 [Bacillus sp. Leaf406]